MQKAHSNINWVNYPQIETPINETNLNKMDKSIDTIDDRVITLDSTKLDVATANGLVKSIEYDSSNGVFTITYLNGSTATIDTLLEKLAINFDYDPTTQQLIITLSDGTKKYIDLSALITQYEFVDTSTIGFTLTTDGKVTAKVLDGSITGSMLDPDYLAEITVQVAKATSEATKSEESATNAKTSETNAKTSETNAKASESNAKGSETNASKSEVNSAKSAQEAQDSATTATTSMQNAKISETNALASENASSISENNALVSERNAKASETIAITKASEASTSASNAKASETNAKASAETAKELLSDIKFKLESDGHLYYSTDNGNITFKVDETTGQLKFMITL